MPPAVPRRQSSAPVPSCSRVPRRPPPIRPRLRRRRHHRRRGSGRHGHERLLLHPSGCERVLQQRAGLPKADAFAKTKAYLAANPQVQDEINAIRGPVFDLRNRCGIPTNNLIRGVL